MTSKLERRVKLITAGAVIVLLTLVIFLVGNIIAAGVLKSREARLKSEYLYLTGQNTQLQSEIDAKNSDIYAELYARDELELVKPGEKVVISK